MVGSRLHPLCRRLAPPTRDRSERPAMNRNRIAQLAPGIALCAAIALAAMRLQRLEEHWTGRPWLEALVIAILLGTATRTFWTPGTRWVPGIGFSAKTLLEIAVMLLGASISAQAVLEAGFGLMLGIAVVVALAIGASYALGRWLDLPWRMAVLVACGNAICGNSAIAAVAPVIGAKPQDVASSIAFTAILGVDRRARPAAAGADPRSVAHAIRRACRAHRLCGAAGARGDRAGERDQHAARHPGEAGARADAGPGGDRPLARRGPRGDGSDNAPVLEPVRALVHPRLLKPRRCCAPSASFPTRSCASRARSRRFSRSSPWRRSASGSICEVLGRVGGRVTLAVTLSLLVLIAISLALIRLLGLP